MGHPQDRRRRQGPHRRLPEGHPQAHEAGEHGNRLLQEGRHYNSYGGGEGDRPENLLKRNFHADAPNMLWLTDITEFGLPQGKVYLSPVIDSMVRSSVEHLAKP